MQGWFNIGKFNDIIQNISKVNEKYHHLIGTKKAFDEMQNPFMILKFLLAKHQEKLVW